jgi:hypothetical protein
MMLERGFALRLGKKGVIGDVFWEWIADSMLEEMVVSAKSGRMFGRTERRMNGKGERT